MPALRDDTLLSVKEDHLTSTLGEEEIILLHLRQGTYYGLEGVSAFIWQQIEAAPRTVAELTALIQAEYAVSEDVCRGDLEHFVEKLRGEDLITLA